MKVEAGKTYRTRGGDYVTNLVCNERRADGTVIFEGELCKHNGAFIYYNWLEDGTFCYMGFSAHTQGKAHPSDLVEEHLDK